MGNYPAVVSRQHQVHRRCLSVRAKSRVLELPGLEYLDCFGAWRTTAQTPRRGHRIFRFSGWLRNLFWNKQRQAWRSRKDARKLYEIDENGALCCLHWFPHGQRVWYGTTDKVPGGILTRELSGGPVAPIYPPSEVKTSWQYTVLPDRVESQWSYRNFQAVAGWRHRGTPRHWNVRWGRRSRKSRWHFASLHRRD